MGCGTARSLRFIALSLGTGQSTRIEVRGPPFGSFPAFSLRAFMAAARIPQWGRSRLWTPFFPRVEFDARRFIVVLALRMPIFFTLSNALLVVVYMGHDYYI